MRTRDDPWAMAKLAGESARQDAALREQQRKIAAKNPRRFSAFKCSLDGNQNRYGRVHDLTLAEARDERRFPLGVQESAGVRFVWQYCLTDAA